MNLPPYFLQSAPGQETNSCEAFSLCNLIFMLTGWLPSMRALAIDANLQNPDNRNAQHVLNIANTIGLVSYSDCPLPAPLTVSSFYNFNTSKLRRQKLNIQLLPANLAVSPIWTALAWGLNLAQPTRHMAPMITATEFVDSEPGGQIKDINKPNYFGASPATITWQSSIKINNKPIMIEFVQNSSKPGEYGLLVSSSVGVSYIPASTETDLIARGGSVVPLKPDGTVDFSKARSISL